MDEKEITAEEADMAMLGLLALVEDPNVEVVDHVVDSNATHGSNPELEDESEVASL